VGQYRPDLIVERQVVVEIKSVLRFEPVFTAQMWLACVSATERSRI